MGVAALFLALTTISGAPEGAVVRPEPVQREPVQREPVQREPVQLELRPSVSEATLDWAVWPAFPGTNSLTTGLIVLGVVVGVGSLILVASGAGLD